LHTDRPMKYQKATLSRHGTPSKTTEAQCPSVVLLGIRRRR
jgi:hypothetical protein